MGVIAGKNPGARSRQAGNPALPMRPWRHSRMAAAFEMCLPGERPWILMMNGSTKMMMVRPSLAVLVNSRLLRFQVSRQDLCRPLHCHRLHPSELSVNSRHLWVPSHGQLWQNETVPHPLQLLPDPCRLTIALQGQRLSERRPHLPCWLCQVSLTQRRWKLHTSVQDPARGAKCRVDGPALLLNIQFKKRTRTKRNSFCSATLQLSAFSIRSVSWTCFIFMNVPP